MATIANLGNTITLPSIYQPKLRNKWRLTFVGLGGGYATGIYLTVQAVSADRPKVGFETVELNRYNTKAYVAGKYTFEPINVVFEDDIYGAASGAIQTQLETQENLIAYTSAPLMPSAQAGQDYKFALRMDMLDGNEVVLESWSIEGCWFSNVDYGDLDYSASEQVRINTTIRYDHARQILTGVSGKVAGAGGAFGEEVL